SSVGFRKGQRFNAEERKGRAKDTKASERLRRDRVPLRVLCVEAFFLTPLGAGRRVALRSTRPTDHSGNPERKSATARLKSSGWSRLAAWPAPGITAFCAPGILPAM